MTQMMEKTYEELTVKTEQYGQDHVFRFWDTLRDDQKERLIGQVKSIDFEHLEQLIQLALQPDDATKDDDQLETAEIVSLKEREQKDTKAEKVGEEALKKGEVAAFLVAGGQGSRLGFDGPKGIYPVTPVKKKSLFRVFAEKLLALQQQYGKRIPWYIMTSITNDRDTKEFFRKHTCFGLDPEQVAFFNQDMIPAIDTQGRLILDAPDHIFVNPNGHGGSLKALWDSGAIADMKANGIKYIFYFQVDNVLTRIADPAFIGYHILAGSEMSNKVVRKAYPEEKMGVICKINGRDGLVEYSDLSEEDMFATDEDGQLKFWAGSVATHVLNVDFVERENEKGFKLPYHIARKPIPYIDTDGNPVNPDEKNGIKFETFVFDALLDTRKSISVEIERRQEFSPLKNKEGVDSAETVHRDLLNYYANWFRKAGFDVPVKDGDTPAWAMEVSPLFARTLKEFLDKKADLPEPSDNLYIE